MIGSLRAAVRLVLLVSVTGLLYALKLLLSPLRRLAPTQHRRVRDALLMIWARSITRVIGMQVRVEGPIPPRPFMLVSNHLGYVDVVLLAAHLPAVFVAKGELARWPLAGRVFASVDTIFLDRGRRRAVAEVNREVAAALEAGENVILFPEGTTSPGREVLPFLPPLLAAPVSLRRPVWYAAVSYRTPPGAPPAGDAVCWWGDAAFGPHLLGLLRLPRFEARLSIGEAPLAAAHRRALADLAQAAVTARHAAMRCDGGCPAGPR